MYHLESWWEDMTWQKEESRGWFQLDMGRGKHVAFIPHCGRFCLSPTKENKQCLKVIQFIFPLLAEQIWVGKTYGRYSYLLFCIGIAKFSKNCNINCYFQKHSKYVPESRKGQKPLKWFVLLKNEWKVCNSLFNLAALNEILWYRVSSIEAVSTAQ